MRTEFSVVRIKTDTLKTLRDIGKIEKLSVPKVIDGLLSFYLIHYQPNEQKTYSELISSISYYPEK
jgi:hypothetical protein